MGASGPKSPKLGLLAVSISDGAGLRQCLLPIFFATKKKGDGPGRIHTLIPHGFGVFWAAGNLCKVTSKSEALLRLMWLPAIGNLKIRGTHCRRTPRKVTRSAEGHHLKMTLWFPIEPLSEKMAAKSQPSYFFNLSNLASQLILATFPRTTGSRTIIS